MPALGPPEGRARRAPRDMYMFGSVHGFADRACAGGGRDEGAGPRWVGRQNGPHELSHVFRARGCLAKRKCIPGCDGVRTQWMAGATGRACDIFRMSLQAFVEDLSLRPQPIGWSVSRVSPLVEERAKDRIESPRPLGVVATTQKWGSMTRMGAFGLGGETGDDEDQRLRLPEAAVLDRAVMPIVVAARMAAE